MRANHCLALLAASGLAACGGGGSPDSTNPIIPVAPSQATMVASGSFEGPMDAVASPDGSTFYFSAHHRDAPADAVSTAAIFAVPSSGGSAQVLASGAPLEDPAGLVMSCDGNTLYVADLSYLADDAADQDDADKSALYTLDLTSGTLTPLSHDGIAEAAGLAFDSECSTLYVTGYTPSGKPALFTLAPEGGRAAIVTQGEPLESPSGVYVDTDRVAWVMDQLPSIHLGGALFAVQPDGTAAVVADGLTISEPAGVSLVAGGEIAVIPSHDLDDNGQLLAIDTKSGDRTTLSTPDILEPAGIRTATNAPVMAVVDSDGDAIYRAE
ncbi:MAG: hypothetical protein MJE77_00990 [Proteobacteria bacterium]|nr:hypothetical protein [Pseudomonadota bacterium]